MELPDIGRQCSEADCKQLDFLPFTCECGKQFCSTHFHIHAETCEPVQVPTNPQRIALAYKCSRPGCNEKSLIRLPCQKCQQHFCLKHRHLTQCREDEKQLSEAKERIDAPVRQFNEAKKILDKQIENNLNEAKKKEKNKNLVNKIQLMKLKNKAKGLTTIPVIDRIYFNVINPGNKEGNPIFVSKNWSIGRAIDAIALECKLQNHNHKSTEKKLRLFKRESGEILTKNMADNISTLISNLTIIDGDHLVVEYVNDDCESLFKNY